MPRPVALLLALCAAWYVAYVLQGLGLDGLPVGDVRLVHLLVMAIGAGLCLLRAAVRRGERAAWTCIGLALVSWIAGETYFTLVLWDESQPPVPSWADAGFLGFPPLLFAGLVLLLRARIRNLATTLWVDGVTAALAAGAVSAAIVVQAVLDAAAGDALAVATNLAYPLSDLVLLAVVAGALVSSGWRLDRTLALIVAAVVAFCVADSVYLVRVAEGAWSSGGPVDAGWWSASVLLPAAAWAARTSGTPPGRVHADGRLVIGVPIAFASLGLGVLVAGSVGHLNAIAISLATASLVCVMLRLVLTFQQHGAMLRASRREALTDALTGLGNRRRLLLDLTATVERAHPANLLLFDLNGFKSYNDAFGHAAGDRLLVRLGRGLADAVGTTGRAYRLGGDEFCVLLDRDADVAATQRRACGSLRTDGPGFSVSAACGTVVLPEEAASASEALTLADERMYADKAGSRPSAAAGQIRDALLAVLDEREPAERERARDTALLARQLGRALGLGAEELDVLTRAAELHDIGLAALPDAILRKPGLLSEEEWAVVRTHPVVSERILRRAAALRPVATLVRAVHERIDGTGYPDGLCGDEIPLGARILAVCDAFGAMTSERPHRAARDADAACAELLRGAGTQFDARVVELFVRVTADRQRHEHVLDR